MRVFVGPCWALLEQCVSSPETKWNDDQIPSPISDGREVVAIHDRGGGQMTASTLDCSPRRGSHLPVRPGWLSSSYISSLSQSCRCPAVERLPTLSKLTPFLDSASASTFATRLTPLTSPRDHQSSQLSSIRYRSTSLLLPDSISEPGAGCVRRGLPYPSLA